jgi:hypothetical protein
MEEAQRHDRRLREKVEKRRENGGSKWAGEEENYDYY